MGLSDAAFSENFQSLIYSSYQIRTDVELDRYIVSPKFVPVDYTRDETRAERRELLGGFGIEREVCTTCFMMLPATGECGCCD